MNRHIAIIPARAGSKSIINKNLQMVGKKHLVKLAVDSCLDAEFCDKIILTTDIDTLVEEFEDSKIDLMRRPKDLASDTAKMMDVVIDTAGKYELKDSDLIWLIQPTTPFRQLFHFIDIKRLLSDSPSAISFCDVGANHPNRTYTIVKGEPKRRKYTNYENKQELKPHYIRNGAFYVCKLDMLRRERTFEAGKPRAYVMDDLYSSNIDSPLDLFFAKSIASIGVKDVYDYMRGLT